MQPSHHQVTDPEVTYQPVTPASVLRAAGGYLHYYGWRQGDLFDNPNQPTPAACALGAIRMAVIGTPEVRAEHNRTGVLAAFDRAIGVFADHLISDHGATPVQDPSGSGVLFTGDLEQVVIAWNDHPARNMAHVIAALNGAADEWDRIHPAAPQDTPPEREATHVDYPHEPGCLYDCPACEATCFCKPGEVRPCVACALDDEDARSETSGLGGDA